MKPTKKQTILAVAILLGFTLLGILWANFKCSRKWSSFETIFIIPGGCQIRLNDKWIPSRSYYFMEW